MPTFSVIVPVYNSESCLERCINSILGQTFQDFELLLINDGSADSSGVICDRFAQHDSRIRVFHKLNGGVSSARNLGLANAQGEWIAFCDSDDRVFPEWLNIFVANMSFSDLVSQGMRFDYSSSYKNTRLIDVGVPYKGNNFSEFLDMMLDVGIVGYVMNKCFRNSIIRENNITFDTRFNIHEDEDFVLKYMACAKNVVSVEAVGYHYIVPNYEHKYLTVRNAVLLYLSLYSSAERIAVNCANCYLEWTKYKIIEAFVNEFDHTAFLKKRRCLLKFKRLVNKNILLSSNMFYLIKYAIFLDFTGILSSSVLWLYCMIKRIKK